MTLLAEHYRGKHNQKAHGRRYSTLAAQAHEGGFSVSFHGNRPPKRGFMVSPYKGAELVVPVAELTADHVRAFAAKYHGLLSKPDHYIGGWRDGDSVYLDVSINALTRAGAKKLAVDGDQLAVYDVRSGTSIPTGDL